MSSKFARTPTPRLRPPICFPPPGSCRRAYTTDHPSVLTGYYKWKDWHPPVPVDLSGIFDMPWFQDTLSWWAGHDRPGTRITLEIWRITFPGTYTVRIDLFIAPDQYLHHYWSGIPFRTPEHIDTGPLSMVNPIGEDYRQARVFG